MLVSDFDFELPEELIAQRPPEVRGASRMLRLDRRTGAWEDRWFRELPAFLSPGDLLVLNDTRVLPARLFATRGGMRTQAGSPAPAGVVEVLLTEQVEAGAGENVWRALVKPAKKVPVGEVLLFAAVPGEDPLLRAEVVGAGEFGERTLRFSTPTNRVARGPGFEPLRNFHAVLEEIGHLPLPPYIRREKAQPNTVEDRERYQTVYSRPFGVDGHCASGSKTQIPFGDDNEERQEQQQIPRSGNDKQEGQQQPQQQIPRSGNDKQEGQQQPQQQIPRSGNDKQEGQQQEQQQIPRSGNDKQEGQQQPQQQIPCGNDNQNQSTLGSAAAPTAGLHFTPEVLAELEERGVEVARVTLHVGLGTFQPVRVERTEEIRLHAEPYTLSAWTAEALNRAWAEGRRIVAVGTTTTRTLEHVARRFEAEFGALGPENPLRLEAHSGSTGLFLSPGPEGDDRFRLVGGLVTNFHLPQSTLLMLVSALGGRERVLAAYRHAVEARYRFFSYGDCMLVL